MTNKRYSSHHIFHIVRKSLTESELHRIFGKSTRYMQMWAADPRYCEVTRRNVLDQVRLMIDALDDHGRGDVSRAIVEYLAEPLGVSLTDPEALASDKGSFEAELSDACICLGQLGAAVREAMADRNLSTAERIRIKELAADVKREVSQILDAAGL